MATVEDGNGTCIPVKYKFGLRELIAIVAVVVTIAGLAWGAAMTFGSDRTLLREHVKGHVTTEAVREIIRTELDTQLGSIRKEIEHERKLMYQLHYRFGRVEAKLWPDSPPASISREGEEP